ncbi:MAG TPA: phosphoethanolamine--lipid A transferase [Arenimonas sp.]|uniref:phosphoethanolamine transferase n=1 Tax=Arenimonas sp. TaxID=1872635 RepID=UPI002D80CF29|nr:phosphoethanolamine--lipid A transferase [Arenimonas sp.]HEU0152887.1 phosphoethanolamine--lipid A transferase [Arenimonas sp.]
MATVATLREAPLSNPTVTPAPRGIGANTLTAIVAALLALAYSASFWRNLVAADLPGGLRGALFLLAAFAVLFVANGLLLSFVAWRGLQKPALALVLVLSASAAYFMDGYGAVVDRHALQSVLETDLREGSEWLSWSMAGYLAVLGLLPALLLWKLPVRYRPWPRELAARAGFMLALLAVLGLAVLPFTREFSSTARNHAELRHLATPTNLVNAVRGYLKHAAPSAPVVVTPLGADARGGSRYGVRKPLLMVIVVGESARVDSFSLAGYPRETNPELAKIAPVFFPNVSSCGTNTATSLPCMFSDLGRGGYDESDARGRENLLDVIAHAGLQVEWEDNNTGSKGVAARQREESMAKLPAAVPCDADGCQDERLVEHLRDELAVPGTGDKVFVLHQIGSHGPAYFKRYPKPFERFTPTCQSVALQDCSQEEIRNSYDNTILYTDHVLAALIRLLEQEAGDRTPALLYLSDHGESTGEHGLYLHGAPYALAPEEQTRVPMLLWTSPEFLRWRGLDAACLQSRRTQPLSHDNFFHTVLGLLDVQTTAYQPGLDALAACAPA